MEEQQSIITMVPEHVVFSVLADVLNAWEDTKGKLQGIKVSVNPSRFGTDEAISIRLTNPTGEGEIGKIVVVPLDQKRYEFKLPVNHTGGSALPALDTKGEVFHKVIERVLTGLEQRGFVSRPPEQKPPLGFRSGHKEHES